MVDHIATAATPPPGDRGFRTENDLLAAIVATQQEVATAGLDPDTVMRVIVDRTLRLTGADGAVVELVEGDEMVYRAAAGTAARYLGVRLKVATSLSGLCVRTGGVLRCDDAETDPQVDREACRRVGARSMVVAPLRHAGQLAGVLKVLAGRPRAFADRDANTLQLVAGLLAAALGNARAFAAERAMVADGEEALRATRERFAAFMNNSPALAFVKDEAGRYTYVNEPYPGRLEMRPGDFIGKTDADLYPPAVARRLRDNDRAVLARGAPVEFEETVPTPDGAARHWLVYKFPFVDGGGRAALGGVALDITDRKAAEARLDQQYEFINRIIDSVPGLFYVFTHAGTYLRWNAELEKVTGYAAAEVARLHPLDLFAGDDRRVIEGRIREVVATGRATAEATLVAKGGGKRRYLFTGRSVELNGTPCVVGVGIDIEDRHRLEGQLRQAQKMEAVGRLAGGIAHDFNNLLTVISGYSALLLDRLPPGAPDREMVDEIHRAGGRAAALTRQLLAFSRQQVLEPRVLDLNRVVADTERMLRRLIGEDLTFATAPAPALRPVKADAGQLEQVIVNLVVNARDAMPAGGRVTVETGNVDLDGEYAATHPDARPGRYVRLAVTDTGVGMTAEVKAHIFEPFFTTKPAGKGTGLGLATVFGIVRQSGGFVDVYSEPGRGTTVKVYLPAVEQAVPAGEAAGGPGTTLQGRETVLVAEDEPAVRAIVRLALRSYGYTVLEAGTGAEAVRAAETHPGPIDLLMTDVVMPGMGGRELAEELAARRPGLKVLYLSGYTDDAVVRHGVLESGTEFMQKPFTPGKLVAKVRQVLDRR